MNLQSSRFILSSFKRHAAGLAVSALVAFGLASLSTATLAGPVLDRIQSAGTVKVCIWPDYYGITFRNPRTQQLVASGFISEARLDDARRAVAVARAQRDGASAQAKAVGERGAELVQAEAQLAQARAAVQAAQARRV